jgi:hypothetical protein
MGPVPSDGGVVRYFSDLYISSYTPTLSALITSRGIDSQTTRTVVLDGLRRHLAVHLSYDVTRDTAN